MSDWLKPFAALVALTAISATPAAGAGDVLKICLDEDLPPLRCTIRARPTAASMSRWRKRSQRNSAGRSRFNGSAASSTRIPVRRSKTNALLSDGRCSLVGGYALTTDSLVVPGVKTAKLPDFEGATGPDHRRRVPLGVLAPSRPYLYSPLTIVLGPKARGRQIAGVGDLKGLRIGIESGTLADAILMTFGDGRLIDDITHLVPGRDDLLGTLERGEFDATLLDLRRFDAYRAAHPDTRLAGSGYFYPIGANRALSASPTTRRCSMPSTRRSPICRPRGPWPASSGGRPHLSAAAGTCDPR